MNTTDTRKPILDASGTVAEWLRDGRGVTIWESHDIGAGRADMCTPADHATGCHGTDDVMTRGETLACLCRKPHWAYVAARTIHAAEDVLFYRPGRVVASWTDTPAGNAAAQRALFSERFADSVRDAPIGRVFTTYTLYRYAMVSATIDVDGYHVQTYGAPLAPTSTQGPDGRGAAVDVAFRVGIREWSAVDGGTEDA